VTKELLDRWAAGAANAGLSAVVAPWLEFVTALFVGNTINAKAAMWDQSLPWTWQSVASIKVAIDSTARPAELLTVHHYWTSLLPKTWNGQFVLADIEHLVTSGWRRLAEQASLLRAPAVTAPTLLHACVEWLA
jgi:hypothetical protein